MAVLLNKDFLTLFRISETLILLLKFVIMTSPVYASLFEFVYCRFGNFRMGNTENTLF